MSSDPTKLRHSEVQGVNFSAMVGHWFGVRLQLFYIELPSVIMAMLNKQFSALGLQVQISKISLVDYMNEYAITISCIHA